MTNDLRTALDHIAERGTPRGAARVVAQALEEFRDGQDRPRRRHGLALVALGVASVLVVGAVAARSRVPDIERVDVAALDGGDAMGEVMTLLVVGTDNGGSASAETRRADAIMLVRLDRETGSLSMLSLPRDLYVPIAGSGRQNRLSTAHAVGPSALVESVRSLTGVRFDHYVEFDFAAFTKVVDAAGGIDLFLPAAVRDSLAGLDLQAGCNHLNGATALAYARARHLQVQDGPDGRFVSDPTGDLGRIGRQQLLLLVAFDQVTRHRDPRRIDRVAQALDDYVRVDDEFSLGDAIDFAKQWVRTRGSVQLLVYPARPGLLANGAAVLHPESTEAAAVVETFGQPVGEDRSPAAASCR